MFLHLVGSPLLTFTDSALLRQDVLFLNCGLCFCVIVAKHILVPFVKATDSTCDLSYTSQEQGTTSPRPQLGSLTFCHYLQL